jgi:hypothetical protein
MYTGPIVKTYYSLAHYRQDAANMAYYGYMPVNVEQLNTTNGLALTLILLFGLVLTPVCIGLIILCFLPFAFSKRWNVSYIQQAPRMIAASQPLMLPQPYQSPMSRPYQPHVPQPYQSPVSRPYQPPMPQQYMSTHQPPSRPLSQPLYPQSRLSPPSGYLTGPSQQTVPFTMRVRDTFTNARTEWASWKGWQQVLSVLGAVLLIAVAFAGILLIVISVFSH